MVYTAQTLITRSWYLSGIVARNLQSVTGDQITDGLMLLNALLDFKQIETDLIPYYTYIEMPFVGGQEYYFLPNIAEVELATFNIDVIRYPMDYTHRRSYFGSGRVDNIQTLPFNWNFNRGMSGGTFSAYFLPQANYPLKMMVKLFLNDVSLQTDLTNFGSALGSGFVSNIQVINGGTGYIQPPTVTIAGVGTGATAFANVLNGAVTSVSLDQAGINYTETPSITFSGGGGTGAVAEANISSYTFLQTNNAGYDTSYIEYLRYALAQYMCSEYGILFNPESEKILTSMKRKLMYMSPPDLTMIKTSILTQSTGINYGDCNLGRGWRPD
jgi:hypothetical protein